MLAWSCVNCGQTSIAVQRAQAARTCSLPTLALSFVCLHAQPKREPRPKKPRVERPASERPAYEEYELDDQDALAMEDDAGDEDFDLAAEVR